MEKGRSISLFLKEDFIVLHYSFQFLTMN